MSEQTYHTTRQDLRKPESRVAAQHGGKTPSESYLSQMKVSQFHIALLHEHISLITLSLQSIVDQNTDKPKQIDEAKSNLPLPDQPPVASDWNSSDQRTVNVGSGGIEGPISGDNDTALRSPATAGSSARIDGEELHKGTTPGGNVGRQRVEGLEDLPSDATARHR